MAKQILSIEELDQIVERDNKNFKKLSKAQKRVRIACDVLRQIKAKKIKPTHGTWVTGVRHKGFKDLEETKFEIDQAFEPIQSCQACALGALLVAKTCHTDDGAYALGYGYYSSPLHELSEFFSTDQLTLIESAFEQGEGAYREEAGANYMPEYDGAKQRMELIMRNIVRNKGKFDPDDPRK